MITPLSGNMELRTSHHITIEMNDLQRAITPTVSRALP